MRESPDPGKAPKVGVASKALAAAIMIAIALSPITGCRAFPKTHQKADVVGVSVSVACSELLAEGWSVDVTDLTPYSDYSHGGSPSLSIPAEAVDQVGCGNETVVDVEYAGSEEKSSAYRCCIYYESGMQSNLEEEYDLACAGWIVSLKNCMDEFDRGKNSDVLAEYAFDDLQRIFEYEKERIPESRVSAHEELIGKYVEFLNQCGYDIYDESNGRSIFPSGKEAPEGSVSWVDAGKHVGETITVYGPIVDYEYASSSKGRPTFLDIGAEYPDADRVTITIWGENRDAFCDSPESLYSGKTVCVTGEIYLYNGVCNIEVSSPKQIAIV